MYQLPRMYRPSPLPRTAYGLRTTLRQCRGVAVPLCIVLGQVVRDAVFVRQRDPTEFAAVDTLNAVAIVLLVTGAFVLFSPRGMLALRQVGESVLGLFLVYFLLCGLSALWSDEWSYTLFRTAQLAINVVLTWWILSGFRDLRLALLFLIRFSSFCVFCGIFGRMRLMGVSLVLRDNATACVAAMSFVMCLSAWKERTLPLSRLLIPGSISLFGLIVARSAAANLSAVVGCVLVMTSGRRSTVLPLQLALVVAILAGAWSLLGMERVRRVLMPDKSRQQVATLHGRVGMWQRYYRGIKERPILGYGFPVGEKRVHVLDDGTSFGTASAHNAVVSVAINTGIVGLVLVTLASLRLFSAMGRALSAGFAAATTVTSVLTTGFVNSLSYPVMGSHWYWTTSVVIAVAVFGACHVRRRMMWHGAGHRVTGRPPRQARRVLPRAWPVGPTGRW